MDGEPPKGKININEIRQKAGIKPRPGTLHNTPDKVEPPISEPGPYISQRLAGEYRLISREFNVDPKFIYYPSCSTDVTPSVAFPEAHVRYADIDHGSVLELKQAGYDSVEEDATRYLPEEEVDLLILLNPMIDPDNPLKAVKEGGHVIANNWHQSADDIHTDPSFEFLGTVSSDVNGEHHVDKEDLEEYWVDASTVEAFLKARPNVSLHQARVALRFRTPKKGDTNCLFVFKKNATDD